MDILLQNELGFLKTHGHLILSIGLILYGLLYSYLEKTNLPE